MNFKKSGGKGNGGQKSGSTTYARTPVAASTALKPIRTSAVEAKPNQKEISAQAIAEAAYFLWMKRGGSELANWLEAEATLRSASKRS